MVEIAYTNSYQASIKMAHFEALYGWKYRLPLHWNEVGERLALVPDVLQEAEAHVLNAMPLELRDNLSFEEQPMRMLARELKKLQNRDILYVKVLWSNHDKREATWELKSALQERYPYLFQIES
ncbi:uncharacterized protein LOC109717940 [Ananas comosus]|uniref:Uncharacterized protein LOC109717940 n=1 Tax=Ananas comosus TaxID=4615 RepID=A0A6P5G2H9_ANACO|nr:uncharacterized protein LOC109717940 [Ananas comosus]